MTLLSQSLLVHTGIPWSGKADFIRLYHNHQRGLPRQLLTGIYHALLAGSQKLALLDHSAILTFPMAVHKQVKE